MRRSITGTFPQRSTTGWLGQTDIADWFADYASSMFERLGDRVAMWATINEPWVIMDGGYMFGKLAPGHRNIYEAPIVSHNVLRAHGNAVRAFRASSASAKAIGLVVNLEPKYAASDSPEDLAATARADAYMNRQYLEPAMHGRYPAEMAEIWGDAWQEWPADDMKLISEKIDFIGVNYYTRSVSKNDSGCLPCSGSGVHQRGALIPKRDGSLPDAFRRILVGQRDLRGLPIYVTENGSAFYDAPSPVDGVVADPLRVAYLRGHLIAARQAMNEGVPLKGYFAWSLLDNFEWSHGYSKRFGIVHVDYATQQRTIKSSGAFYREVIQSNGAALDG